MPRGEFGFFPMKVSMSKGVGWTEVFLSHFLLCSTIQKGLESKNAGL